MTGTTGLYWAPVCDDWRSRLVYISNCQDRAAAWNNAVSLANAMLDFVQTNALDSIVQNIFQASPPAELAERSIKLAILGSSTFAHLHSAIRIAGLRRSLWISIYENNYGQYLQELMDSNSDLYRYQPDVIIFSFDAYHLAHGINSDDGLEEIKSSIKSCWEMAKDAFGCQIIQQTALPVLSPLLGSNENRQPTTPASLIAQLNIWFRDEAMENQVDLLALDSYAANTGLYNWHDVALWHRSKQEISPKMAPVYGDMVGRILAARIGRSFKCLVLDLDNTLWGGVIGDDGLDGITLGQGSPLGEAFALFQNYVLALAKRGVILAICSKNDEENALAPFDRHPEMILRREHIACFIANWNDKPANIREIAAKLNIGLDAIVFLDDNPFERDLVRRELPMVAVPEIGDDPSHYPRMLHDAGYFESLKITEEDHQRGLHYQTNRVREQVMASSSDLRSYLQNLRMELCWRPFDTIGLQRITQLVNKTNQFNLRTRRYSEDQLAAIGNDPLFLTLQLRLIDRFGDNGMIAVVIGKKNSDDLFIDTWLMSCRVLGREVEAATLNLIADQAKKLGVKRLIGEYCPTARNGMVKDYYAKLGFVTIETASDGTSLSALDLEGFVPKNLEIKVNKG